MTLREKLLEGTSHPYLLPEALKGDGFLFEESYYAKTPDGVGVWSFIDDYFVQNYGSLQVIKTLEKKDAFLSDFSNNVIQILYTHKLELNRLWLANNAEYNPVENYDRWEDGTYNFGNQQKVMDYGQETHNAMYGEQETTSEATNKNSGKATSGNTTTTKGTVEGQVSAFDSSAYQPKEKTITDNTVTSSSTGSSEGTSTDTGSVKQKMHQDTLEKLKHQDVEQDAEYLNTENIHIHGNIGVTTAQQMIEAEWQLRDHYVFYKYLMELIVDHTTTGIYDDMYLV